METINQLTFDTEAEANLTGRAKEIVVNLAELDKAINNRDFERMRSTLATLIELTK